ncbi:hypothetical protein ScPMuIL_004687 [Solemya velum]
MWKSTLFLALTVCLMFTMNFEGSSALMSRKNDDDDLLPFLFLMMMMGNNGFGNQQKQTQKIIVGQPSFGGYGKGMMGGYGYY